MCVCTISRGNTFTAFSYPLNLKGLLPKHFSNYDQVVFWSERNLAKVQGSFFFVGFGSYGESYFCCIYFYSGTRYDAFLPTLLGYKNIAILFYTCHNLACELRSISNIWLCASSFCIVNHGSKIKLYVAVGLVQVNTEKSNRRREKVRE